MIKVGLLREGKVPVDRRVPLTPEQCVEVMQKYTDVEIVVQPSEIRSYTDDEYAKLGIKIQKDLSDCDILMGVKEVNVNDLIPNKKFIFFSHTTKKQMYNQKLFQSIIKKKIHLIDYEHLTDKNHIRVVAFGRYAGIVGAYNGLIAYGKRYGLYDLKPAHKCFNMEEMFQEVKKTKLKEDTKIIITGTGRVAKGALETLSHLNLKKVSPKEFLENKFNEAVLCQIDADVYTKRKDGSAFDFNHFFTNPEMYESTFLPFTKVADFYLACHFWDVKSPVFIKNQDMRATDFNIKVIADISCDLKRPIASTIRTSTIDNPLYGYNPITEREGDTFAEKNVTVMAIDNLPCELPRDASHDFGMNLINRVFPSLFGDDHDEMIKRGSITMNGKLTEHFSYLADYAAGK